MKKLLLCVSLLVISPAGASPRAGLEQSPQEPLAITREIAPAFDSIPIDRNRCDFDVSAIFAHSTGTSRPDFHTPISAGFEIVPPVLPGSFSNDQDSDPVTRLAATDRDAADPCAWLLTASPERLSDIGDDIIDAVPAPGAFILGGLGAGLVGWLRRHRTL